VAALALASPSCQQGVTEVVDFTRVVDGNKSLLSAVALRFNQVLTEVVDFTRVVDDKKS